MMPCREGRACGSGPGSCFRKIGPYLEKSKPNPGVNPGGGSGPEDKKKATKRVAGKATLFLVNHPTANCTEEKDV